MYNSTGGSVHFKHDVFEIDSGGVLRNKETKAKVTDADMAAGVRINKRNAVEMLSKFNEVTLVPSIPH